MHTTEPELKFWEKGESKHCKFHHKLNKVDGKRILQDSSPHQTPLLICEGICLLIRTFCIINESCLSFLHMYFLVSIPMRWWHDEYPCFWLHGFLWSSYAVPMTSTESSKLMVLHELFLSALYFKFELLEPSLEWAVYKSGVFGDLIWVYSFAFQLLELVNRKWHL